MFNYAQSFSEGKGEEKRGWALLRLPMIYKDEPAAISTAGESEGKLEQL